MDLLRASAVPTGQARRECKGGHTIVAIVAATGVAANAVDAAGILGAAGRAPHTLVNVNIAARPLKPATTISFHDSPTLM